jgi:DNA-binding transcriptional LysR family regulator
MVRYPQVSVDLTLSNELVDIVDHGYDVVFRIGELASSGLKAMPLEPYQMVFALRRPTCTSPSHHESVGSTAAGVFGVYLF